MCAITSLLERDVVRVVLRSARLFVLLATRGHGLGAHELCQRVGHLPWGVLLLFEASPGIGDEDVDLIGQLGDELVSPRLLLVLVLLRGQATLRVEPAGVDVTTVDLAALAANVADTILRDAQGEIVQCDDVDTIHYQLAAEVGVDAEVLTDLLIGVEGTDDLKLHVLGDLHK